MSRASRVGVVSVVRVVRVVSVVSVCTVVSAVSMASVVSRFDMGRGGEADHPRRWVEESLRIGSQHARAVGQVRGGGVCGEPAVAVVASVVVARGDGER